MAPARLPYPPHPFTSFLLVSPYAPIMPLDTPRTLKLDQVITRRRSQPNVLSTLSYHSADYDTDHTLVCSLVRLQAKKLKTSSPHKHCQAFWLWASAQIPGGIPRGPPGSRCHFRVVRLEGGHPPFGHVGLQQRGEAKSRLVQRQPLDHGASFWGQTTSPLELQKEPFEKTLTTLSAARNATQSTARR